MYPCGLRSVLLRVVLLTGDVRGTEVRQYTASCLVKMPLCFVRCHAHKPNRHPPSVCAAHFPRLAAQLPPHRKNLRFFLSASLLCNTLHLAGKERVPAVPSGLPKGGASACEKLCACSPAQPFPAPHSPHGKDQNHCVPCFTDRIASSAFAFFAVLSLTPAYAILSIISR